MTIRLCDYPYSPKVIKSGDTQGINVPPGTALKIETTPDGEELLNAVCPPGKAWVARVIVEITETDA